MNESDIDTLKEIANFCDTIEGRIQEFSINEETFVSNDALQDMHLVATYANWRTCEYFIR